MEIAGSVALVTGASSGIGAATAVALAERGATVVVTARRRAELEATADRCRAHTPDSLAIPGDLALAEDCNRVVAATIEAFGRLDILVNNAGITMHKHALDTAAADVERILQVNFLAAVRTTTAALPGMVERGRGSVINVTSVAGAIPNPKESAYGASKAALQLWSHGLAVDLDGSGVHVGAVSPGPIDTDIWDFDETPASYEGPKYPPEMVADAIVQAVEKELVHVTVPRRFGAVGALYPLPVVGRAIRKGLVRFEEAGERRRAANESGDTLAFVCAMPMETKPLRKKLGLKKTSLGGMPAWRGSLGDRPVITIFTGMGTKLATESTERLLDNVDVARVIVVGITGALESETPIGTLVVPEVVVHSGTGSEHRPEPLGGHEHRGTMWTTDDLLTGADVLADLRGRGVVSLDMETAAIAAVCEARGVPWSVFRAISDRANDGSVDEEVFRMSNQDGSPNPRAVARYFLHHPGDIPRLAKLAKGATLATVVAADAAIEAARQA